MAKEEHKLTINEASERLGVSNRTLHHYEEKFNLAIDRNESGKRVYSEENIEILAMIIELKNKGMGLGGIKKLLEEKGVIPTEESSKIIVMEQQSVEVENLLIEVIKNTIREELRYELQSTNEKLEDLVAVTNDIKEELLNTKKELQMANERHFKDIDDKLTAWRNSKDRPWYKRFMK